MEHSRKQKLLMIVALIVGIVSLSVGFAAFSVSLNISSSASVSPNGDTFSVKFSTNQNSLVVDNVVPSDKTSGLVTTDGLIDNAANPTIKGLSVTFTEPGQYVEYTFYARNEGEYTAYLNNVNFVGEKTCVADVGTTDSLVQSACESINIYVNVGNESFSETTPVTGHSLEKKTGEIVRVLIQYVGSGISTDGPFTVKFPYVALVYSTLDDPSIKPEFIKIKSGDLNTIGSVVSIDREQFYIFGQEDGNVKLLSMYNLYVGNIVHELGDAVPLAFPTGIQSSSAIGSEYDSSENPVNFPWVATTAFASFSQKGTNYSDYNGSIVEGYVNNYASYLEGHGVNVEEARLITKEELEALGCNSGSYTCSGAPEFVYKTTYWSKTAYDSEKVWHVSNDAYIGYAGYEYPYGPGVRPVVEISLSEFEKA